MVKAYNIFFNFIPLFFFCRLLSGLSLLPIRVRTHGFTSWFSTPNRGFSSCPSKPNKAEAASDGTYGLQQKGSGGGVRMSDTGVSSAAAVCCTSAAAVSVYGGGMRSDRAPLRPRAGQSHRAPVNLMMERGKLKISRSFSHSPTLAIFPRELRGFSRGAVAFGRPFGRRSRGTAPGVPPAGSANKLEE
jgi:hypothetical protein